MTDAPRLLETAHGFMVDASEYSDEDLRRTVALLDIWWNELGDAPPVTSRREQHQHRVKAFAASIGAPGLTLHDICDRLQEHGRTRSFFAVRGPAEGFLRQDLLLLSGAAATVRARLRPGRGTIVSLNASSGGVPKTRLDHVTIGWRGLDGDRQASRLHHGRPWQAVSLWSAEVIAALVAEGHSLSPGAAGENVTVEGLDWELVVPGVRLRIGTALVEASLGAQPCSKLSALFRDGRVDRIDPHLRPRVARMYASVIEPGHAAPGDAVLVS